MRVLVCGSRYWADAAAIHRELERIGPDSLITGGCRGADLIAHNWAKSRRIRTIEELYIKGVGRAGGPMRNRRMLTHRPELVLAFHEDFLRSRGTYDMVKQARRAGVLVEVYDLHGLVCTSR